MEARITYTGYLRRTAAGWPPETGPDLPEQPYVLVTTGGGGDGADLVDWVLRAYESDRTLRQRALIVYGPFMHAASRQAFEARVAALGGRVTAINFHARLERLLAGASGVVAMGGYNTFCEILSMDKPAIIVPRDEAQARAADPGRGGRAAGARAHAAARARRRERRGDGAGDQGAGLSAAALGPADRRADGRTASPSPSGPGCPRPR